MPSIIGWKGRLSWGLFSSIKNTIRKFFKNLGRILNPGRNFNLNKAKRELEIRKKGLIISTTTFLNMLRDLNELNEQRCLTNSLLNYIDRESEIQKISITLNQITKLSKALNNEQKFLLIDLAVDYIKQMDPRLLYKDFSTNLSQLIELLERLNQKEFFTDSVLNHIKEQPETLTAKELLELNKKGLLAEPILDDMKGKSNVFFTRVIQLIELNKKGLFTESVVNQLKKMDSEELFIINKQLTQLNQKGFLTEAVLNDMRFIGLEYFFNKSVLRFIKIMSPVEFATKLKRLILLKENRNASDNEGEIIEYQVRILMRPKEERKICVASSKDINSTKNNRLMLGVFSLLYLKKRSSISEKDCSKEILNTTIQYKG